MNRDSEQDYREFVNSRLQRLASFAFAQCRDWHQAEDIVQRSLVRLYRKWTKVAHTNPDAYVRRIIVNLLHDDRRTGWFRRERVAEVLPDRHSHDPSDQTASRLSVLTALAQLPPRQRQAVLLRHWEDMSVQDTAIVMGCSEGTVKTQTSRGLKALTVLLEDAAIEELKGIHA
ncbi:SigE family RNA polymerase sigma factor [Stackebrandtia soli]|uniref:SigE family RNA polymerase sigma factor n=1 Tax=Stackebrandtia soli TaxID=1892856 RepID=UPI0039ED444B